MKVIVVIADEAHRSQYDFIDGFARHMRDALPQASFVGFTGTPIEKADANTRAVFGDYISIYDIARAVEDGATVPIYYEGRLAKLELSEAERPRIASAITAILRTRQQKATMTALEQAEVLSGTLGGRLARSAGKAINADRSAQVDDARGSPVRR